MLIDNNTMFHKGVAYVEFACNEDAKNAIKFMDGGRQLPLSAKTINMLSHFDLLHLFFLT